MAMNSSASSSLSSTRGSFESFIIISLLGYSGSKPLLVFLIALHYKAVAVNCSIIGSITDSERKLDFGEGFGFTITARCVALACHLWQMTCQVSLRQCRGQYQVV